MAGIGLVLEKEQNMLTTILCLIHIQNLCFTCIGKS